MMKTAFPLSGGSMTIPITEAEGRVASEPIYARYTVPGLPWTTQSILSGAWGSSPSPRTTIAAPSRARVIVQCAIGGYGTDGSISVCKPG